MLGPGYLLVKGGPACYLGCLKNASELVDETHASTHESSAWHLVVARILMTRYMCNRYDIIDTCMCIAIGKATCV